MTFREGRLVRVLVSMADTLVLDFDPIDLFYELVGSCTDLLDVAQAGLLLTDGNGELRVVAASSEATAVVELLELDNQGGPGMEAFRTGRPVRSGDLAGSKARHRWTEFGEAARGAGFRAVTAVPMRLRDQVLGALNLFSTEAVDLTDEDLTVAQAMADLATIAILQDRGTIDDRTLISQLRAALETRVVIEQAKGVVAHGAEVTMDEAFRRIRNHARSNNERLRDVTAAIVSGDLTLPHLTPAD
ncbi:MAG TPA: GAF and ANTAR domain-containing protein [Acidimicrobiia bacterium]|nr:GAF and ANTAR domain-containing protein [Acidimicrobiia bacterium]